MSDVDAPPVVLFRVTMLPVKHVCFAGRMAILELRRNVRIEPLPMASDGIVKAPGQRLSSGKHFRSFQRMPTQRPLVTQRMYSIQVKIGAVIIFLNTVIFLGFGFYQYWDTSAYENQRLASFATYTAAQLSVNLASPLWDIDQLQVQRAVEAEMQDEDIHAIVVKDDKQKIFLAKTRSEEWAVVDAQEAEFKAEIAPAMTDIVRDGRQVGTVEVYVTRRFLQAHLNQAIIKIGIMALICDGVLVVLLIISIRLLLIRSLVRLLGTANAIADGDFSQESRFRQRDEIGALGRAVAEMQAKIARVLQDLDTVIQGVQAGNLAARGQVDTVTGGWRELVTGINQVLEAFMTPMTQINHTLARVAQGDLTETLSTDYQGDFATMMQQVQIMTTTLTDVVLKVKTAAQDVALRSREMSIVADQMSEGASEQASATEEVSASMEEMAANIRQTADNARITEGMALKSAEDARAGNHAVKEIIQAMEVIAERISVIQDIAGQTNILSLNATIEAAKAESFGKGFTVVASSVRDLARQSRAAADEIHTLVHSCVVLSAQAGEVLQRLVPNSEKTAELVQEISAAAQEQSNGVGHVNEAIQQLDTVTQHTAATAEEVAATAENLTTQAEALQNAIAFFTVNEAPPPALTREEDLLRRLQELESQLAELRSAALTSHVVAPGAAPGPAAENAQTIRNARLRFQDDDSSVCSRQPC